MTTIPDAATARSPSGSPAWYALSVRVHREHHVHDHLISKLFPPGSRVRFCAGPLAELEAVFDRPTSRFGRVRVLMTLLGRQTGLEVDALDLEDA